MAVSNKKETKPKNCRLDFVLVDERDIKRYIKNHFLHINVLELLTIILPYAISR